MEQETPVNHPEAASSAGVASNTTADTVHPPGAPLTAARARVRPAQCPNCGAGDPDGPSPELASYIYAVGHIEGRFPSLSIEKEFAQIAGRTETAGKTDQQVLHAVLSQSDNRYLVRHLCWVFSVQGLETYLLRPRDTTDFDRLLGAIRPQPTPSDLDVVVGVRGSIASSDECNGLMLPLVTVDQIYSFDWDALLKGIPKPAGLDAKKFRAASEEVFSRILQLTDNAGSTPEHRALNYLAMRYPGIYVRAAERFASDYSLTGVETRPSTLGGVRQIVDVYFVFTNRNTDFTERYLVRVDVTDCFPFLVSKLAPSFER